MSQRSGPTAEVLLLGKAIVHYWEDACGRILHVRITRRYVANSNIATFCFMRCTFGPAGLGNDALRTAAYWDQFFAAVDCIVRIAGFAFMVRLETLLLTHGPDEDTLCSERSYRMRMPIAARILAFLCGFPRSLILCRTDDTQPSNRPVSDGTRGSVIRRTIVQVKSHNHIAT